MSGVDQHAEAHRLKDELGYGARRIGKELGISRYAAEQLLARPVAEPVGQVADEVAVQVAEHLADGGRLVIALDQFPGLAEDLAVLRRTGCTAQAAVDYAVAILAEAYRNALRDGLLAEDEPLDVTGMEIRPATTAAVS